MRRFRVELAYDGTDFAGWQVQPDARTVQGSLVDALRRVLGEAPRVVGASRTDAGVHARGQVASFDAETRLDEATLARALNSLTPDDIVVRSVRETSPDFHARFQAIGKRYRYRLRAGGPGCPFDRRFSWHLRGRLDVDAMANEALALVGEHDFTSFRAAGCSAAGPVRRIDSIELVAVEELLTIDVRGGGFLRHMVRNIVGTLAEVGRGRSFPGGVAGVLAARDRALAGATAPALGLCLEEVHFGPEPPLRDEELSGEQRHQG